MATEAKYRIVKTQRGYAGFIASDAGVRHSYLPMPTRAGVRDRIDTDAPDATEDKNLLPQLADDLVRFFAGEAVAFDSPLDTSDQPDFYQRTWRATRNIDFGETLTYQQLAALAGNPRAARAVGAAMANNPLPPMIPCHRVLRSDGKLGGFSGPGGISMKSDLLEMERAACATC